MSAAYTWPEVDRRRNAEQRVVVRRTQDQSAPADALTDERERFKQHFAGRFDLTEKAGAWPGRVMFAHEHVESIFYGWNAHASRAPAAPSGDALAGLVGWAQMLLARNDLPPTIRRDFAVNHRLTTAVLALASASKSADGGGATAARNVPSEAERFGRWYDANWRTLNGTPSMIAQAAWHAALAAAPNPAEGAPAARDVMRYRWLRDKVRVIYRPGMSRQEVYIDGQTLGWYVVAEAEKSDCDNVVDYVIDSALAAAPTEGASHAG